MLKRLEKCKEAEAALDIEIEKQLGYTVGMNELWALYETDMKLLNQIEADKAGTIKAILADNGQSIEYGQILFVIE